MSIQKILFPTGNYTYIHAILDGLIFAVMVVIAEVIIAFI